MRITKIFAPHKKYGSRNTTVTSILDQFNQQFWDYFLIEGTVELVPVDAQHSRSVNAGCQPQTSLSNVTHGMGI